MKTLIFTLITLSFALSHAGRIDNYYRGLATKGKTLKTKEEIADYLNSLSKEELVELHSLREKINREAGLYLSLSSVGAFGAVGIGAIVMDDHLKKESTSPRAKRLLKRGVSISGGVVALGFLTYIYGLYKINQAEGLGWDWDSADDIKPQVRDYINSLTLEEAREVLADIRDINDNLKKETK